MGKGRWGLQWDTRDTYTVTQWLSWSPKLQATWDTDGNVTSSFSLSLSHPVISSNFVTQKVTYKALWQPYFFFFFLSFYLSNKRNASLFMNLLNKFITIFVLSKYYFICSIVYSCVEFVNFHYYHSESALKFWL